MLNKRLILLTVILLLSIASVAVAQKQQIKEYTVQKGDTLWDISKKELSDPFLWPKVWKENPDIANPDRLTPGQVIRIPLYLIQAEEKVEEPAIAQPEMTEPTPASPPVQMAEPAPLPAKPLVDPNLYTASGMIAPTLKDTGRITGSPMEKKLLGTLDMIYVITTKSAQVGDRFYIFRIGQLIKHPVTHAPVGYLIETIGIAEVKKFEFGQTVAQILKTYNDVNVGDHLYDYSPAEPPVVDKPYRKPDVQGYVVAARMLRKNNGTADVIYLDKGRDAGLEPGDLIRTVAVGKYKIPNGIAQVFRVQDTTSVAIIRESTSEIAGGNQFTKAE